MTSTPLAEQSGRADRALRRALGTPLLVLALLSCGESSRPAPRTPLLLIGIDGLDPRLVMRFACEGHLPNLADLMRRGTYGQLDTIHPNTWSPVIWTTIATGKLPQKHGIDNFAYKDVDGVQRLYTSGHRRSKALWNIASEQGMTVHAIGWWITYPVEDIRGVMVSQTSTRRQIDLKDPRNIWKGSLLKGVEGQIHPPERIAEIESVADQARAGLPDFLERRFKNPGHALTPFLRKIRENSEWSFRADRIYAAVAGHLLEKGPPPDVLMVYLGSVDVVCHRYFRWLYPDLYKPPPPREEVEDFGETILRTYTWVDEEVGRLREQCPSANVIVVSDHGFHPVNVDQSFGLEEGQVLNSGDHQDGPPAMLVAAGPDLRDSREGRDRLKKWQGEPLPTLGKVADVLATVLVLKGLPIGRDMDGAPLESMVREEFLKRFPPRFIDSYEDGSWRTGRNTTLARTARMEEKLDQEEQERLQALGYLSQPIADPPSKGK